MPIQTTIDAGRNLVSHMAHGLLNTDEVIRAIDGVLLNPQFNSDMNILIELCAGVTTGLGSEDVHQIIKTVRLYGPRRGLGKTAVIAPTDEEFGISQVCKLLLRNEQRELKVFRDKSEAARWLSQVVAA